MAVRFAKSFTMRFRPLVVTAAGVLAGVTVLITGPGTASALAPPVSAAGSTAQQFQEIVARHSSDCLDVSGASTAAGAQVIQWPCHGGANQQWILIPNGAGHYFALVRSSADCLDVSGASRSAGASVIQWPCHGGTNQQWDRIDVGSGYYRLVAVHSGLCLDVSGASTSGGAKVIQWPCHGGTNQQWHTV